VEKQRVKHKTLPLRDALAVMAISIVVLALGACGGSDSNGGTSNSPPTTYTLGGSLTGLVTGGSLVLQDNGGNNLTLSANGNFTFSTALAGGTAYAVTVLTQPTGQSCNVTNGSGTVSASNVTAVTIACTNTYTVGGTLTGLSGTLVLQNNGGNNLTLSANGAFTFSTGLTSSSAYAVTVSTQPNGQICTVGNGSGSIGNSNVTGVAVNCTYNSSNATLNGTYNWLIYGLAAPAAGANLVYYSTSGTSTFSGGNSTATPQIVNFDGTIVTTGFTASSGTYSVTSNGTVTTGGAGSDTASGGVLGADGGADILMDITPNGPPTFSVALKAPSGMTQASLQGKYVIVALSIAPNYAYSQLGNYTIDAVGNLAGSATKNRSGTVSTVPVSTSVTVSGTGVLAAYAGGEVGAISADGDLLMLHDVTSNERPAVSFGVKQGSGVSLATLSGSYTAVVFRSALNGGTAGTTSALAKVILDGNGNFSGTITNNDGGAISSSQSSGTYTAQSDGTITLIGSSSTTYQGAVSADGNAFVLADIASGDASQIIVGLRQ
jgi:large repetitive protein